jgi:hypothetical protein
MTNEIAPGQLWLDREKDAFGAARYVKIVTVAELYVTDVRVHSDGQEMPGQTPIRTRKTLFLHCFKKIREAP